MMIVCKRGHKKTPANCIRSFNGRYWYMRCRECNKGRKRVYMRGWRRKQPQAGLRIKQLEYERRYKNQGGYDNWLVTPKGQQYLRRNRLGLSASAPEDLCRAVELLRQLKKEFFNAFRGTE